jgi:hypothetical protein
MLRNNLDDDNGWDLHKFLLALWLTGMVLFFIGVFYGW